MQAVKDFVIKIGFDYDKGGQKTTENSFSKLTAGAGKIGSALGKAEAQAKKSLSGVSKAAENSLGKVASGAKKISTELSKVETQAKKSLDGVAKTAEKSIGGVSAGAVQIGTELSKAEAKAKKSLSTVSKAFDEVNDSVKSAAQETKQLNNAIDKTNQEAVKDVKEIDNAFGGLGETVSKVKGLIIALVGGLTISNLAGYVTAAADKFEQLGQTAKEIGTDNVESLAAMQYAFSQFGVEADTLNDGLKNMTDYIGQAKLGEGEGLEVFKALKISVTDTNGQARDTIEIFDELVDKMSSLDHATQVTYINMLGLDTEMIKGMTANKEQLDEFRAQFLDTYAKAGVNINEVAEKSTAFNQSLRALKNTIQTIKDAIGAKFLDVGIKTFDRLRVIATDNMDKIIDTATRLIDILYSMFKAVANLGKMFVDMISRVIDWWNQADETFKTVVIALGAVTAALVVLNSEFMKSPIGRFITLMIALAALIEDYQKWKEGSGKTVLGRLLGDYSEFINKLDAMTDHLGIFKGAVMWAAQHADILLASLAALPYAFKLVKSGASGVNSVLQIFGTLVKSVKDILGVFKGALAAVLFILKPVGIALRFLIGLIPLLISGLVKLSIAFFSLPIGWVIAIIAAIIAAIWLIWDNWDVICEYLGKAWDWIKEKFNAGIEFLSNLFSGFFDWLSGVVDILIQPFKELWGLLTDIGNALKSKFGGFLAKFGIEFDDNENPEPESPKAVKAKESQPAAKPTAPKYEPESTPRPTAPRERPAAMPEMPNPADYMNNKALLQSTKDLTATQNEQTEVGSNLIDIGTGLGDMAQNATEKFKSACSGIESFNGYLNEANKGLNGLKDTLKTANETAESAKEFRNEVKNLFSRTENDNRSYTDQSSVIINVKDGNEAATVINKVTKNKSGSRNNRSHVW